MKLEKCSECGGTVLIGVPVGDWSNTPICDCHPNEDGSWTVGNRKINSAEPKARE